MSYNLRELGRADDGLVAQWRRVLPADAIYELHYENLINDFETEARKLLAFCELRWDAGVLNFRTSNRRVRTASVTNVLTRRTHASQIYFNAVR